MADTSDDPRVVVYRGTVPGWAALLLVVPALLVLFSVATVLLVGGATAALLLPLFFRRRRRGQPLGEAPETIELDPSQYTRVESHRPPDAGTV